MLDAYKKAAKNWSDEDRKFARNYDNAHDEELPTSNSVIAKKDKPKENDESTEKDTLKKRLRLKIDCLDLETLKSVYRFFVDRISSEQEVSTKTNNSKKIK